MRRLDGKSRTVVEVMASAFQPSLVNITPLWLMFGGTPSDQNGSSQLPLVGLVQELNCAGSGIAVKKNSATAKRSLSPLEDRETNCGFGIRQVSARMRSCYGVKLYLISQKDLPLMGWKTAKRAEVCDPFGFKVRLLFADRMCCRQSFGNRPGAAAAVRMRPAARGIINDVVISSRADTRRHVIQ